MTVLDNFIAFARALPAERREAMNDALALLMASYAKDHDFTPDELADLQMRADESNPELSDPEEISRIFGKPFRA